MNLKKAYLFTVLFLFSTKLFAGLAASIAGNPPVKPAFIDSSLEQFAAFEDGTKFAWLSGAKKDTFIVVLKDSETSFRVLPFKMNYTNPRGDLKGYDTSSLVVDELNPETGLVESVRYELDYFVNDVEYDLRRGEDFTVSLRRSSSGVETTKKYYNSYFSQHNAKTYPVKELLPLELAHTGLQKFSLTDEIELQYFDLGTEVEVRFLNTKTLSWESFRFKKKLGKTRNILVKNNLLGERSFSFTYTDAKATKLQRVELSKRFSYGTRSNLLYSKDINAKKINRETPIKFLYEGVIPNSDAQVILAQYEQKIPHQKARKAFVFIMKSAHATFISPLEVSSSGALVGTIRYFNMARGRFVEESVYLENSDRKTPITDSLKSLSVTFRGNDIEYNHQSETQINLKKTRKTKEVLLSKVVPLPWVNTSEYECFRAGASPRFFICLRDRGYVPELNQGQEVIFWDSVFGAAQSFEAILTKKSKEASLDVNEFSFAENTEPWFSPLHLRWFLNASPFYDVKLYVKSLGGKAESRMASLVWTPLEILRPKATHVESFTYENRLAALARLCETELLAENSQK